MFSKIKDYFKLREVYIWDHYYDIMIDADDLDDSRTLCKVTYSKFRGIIKSEYAGIMDARFEIRCDGKLCRTEESPLKEIKEFYKICNIDEFGGINEYKKYTCY